MSNPWGGSWGGSWGDSWKVRVHSPPAPPLPAPAPPTVYCPVSWDEGVWLDAAWDEGVVASVSWDGLCGTGGSTMYQLREPVRRQNLIPFVYTFRNRCTGAAISLGSFVRVDVEYKLNGATYSRAPATFVDKAGGVVTASLRFNVVGKWDVQFVCYTWLNEPFYGTSIQLDVFSNVDDLSLATSMEA